VEKLTVAVLAIVCAGTLAHSQNYFAAEVEYQVRVRAKVCGETVGAAGGLW
jgi:hypothetical protein